MRIDDDFRKRRVVRGEITSPPTIRLHGGKFPNHDPDSTTKEEPDYSTNLNRVMGEKHESSEPGEISKEDVGKMKSIEEICAVLAI